MFFYTILPNKYLPLEFLTYSHAERLLVGQLVFITIGSKKYAGVVLEEVDFSKLTFDVQKVKSISEIIPYYFQPRHISFLFSFSYNTFNHPADVFDLMARTIIDLPKTLAKTLLTSYEQKLPELLNNSLQKTEDIINKPKIQPIVEALLDIDITLRIIYIIRTKIYEILKNAVEFNQTGNTVFVIIVPENKVLDKICEQWNESEQEFIAKLSEIAIKKTSTNQDVKNICKIYPFSTKAGVKTRRNFLQDYLLQTLPQFSIIIGTRSALFLPFPIIDHVYLIDEANNFHIQDQNNVYFDTRDAIFMLSQSYGCNLTFLSTLPSIRLQHFYSESILTQQMNNVSLKDKNVPEVSFFQRAIKDDDFDSILRIMNDDILNTHFDFQDEEE